MTSLDIGSCSESVCSALSGNRLAVATYNNEIEFFDIAAGTTLGRLTETDAVSFTRALSFSPIENGQLLATGGTDYTVRLWDTLTKECVMTGNRHTDQVKCVAFSPDGQTLVSGSYDANIWIWDVTRGTHIRAIEDHQNTIHACKFSSDGKILVSSSYDHTVRLFSMPNATALEVINCDNFYYCIDLSADNMLAISTRRGIVEVWDLGSKPQLVTKINTKESEVAGVRFSPNGKQLVTSSDGRSLKVWNWETSRLLNSMQIKKINYGESIDGIDFLPDGKRMLCRANTGATARFILFVAPRWSDRNHHLFSPELRRIVFRLMCIKKRQEDTKTSSRLSMQLWLNVFQELADAKEPG